MRLFSEMVKKGGCAKMLIKPEVKEEIRKAIAKKIKPDQDEVNYHGLQSVAYKKL